MACVSPRKTAKGVVYDIQFYLTKKDKKKLYGFTNKRIAERFGEKLETIIASKRTGLRDLDVEDWLLALLKSDPDRYNKLVHWGLAEPRTPCIVLKELVSHFVQDSEVKEQTKKNRQTVGNRLISFFGAERLVDSLTSQDVAAFQTAMASKYAPCTWGRDIKTVKQFFQYAVQEHWLDENPFRHLKGSNQSNPSRFFFVPMDTVKRVLDACPNSEMRLIFSLARFGGLRIPSELQFMEWSDIDVTSDRFIVRSPKKTNKRQQEAGNLTTRVVPMFPELRRAFEEYYADFPEGGSSLLFPQLPTGQALTSRFMKILHRAGVTAWPKFFQNMRSTRETELTDRYPLQDVTSWLGNTPSVAQKHYLQTRPEFYARASRDATFTEEKTIGIEPTRLLETKAVQPSSSIHHEKQLYLSSSSKVHSDS